MWKYGIVFCSCLLPLLLCGQPAPRWMDSRWRETAYPADSYFTGFVSESVSRGESAEKSIVKLEGEAKRKIAESMMVRIKSEQTLIDESVQGNSLSEQFISRYGSVIITTSDVEITGVKTETWFDKAKKTLYAFAYANKRELIAYYAATIAGDVPQIEGLVKAAARLEAQGEKARARTQYKEAAGVLAKTAKVQALLMALGAASSGDVLPPEGWQALREEVTQALARLTLLVYVNGREELFGKPCAIVTDKLTAALTAWGYLFTEDPVRADYTLHIQAATRKIGEATGTIVFCYADVVVELVDNRHRESVYKEALSHKGGSTTFERAGREALEEAAAALAEKLNKIIE